MRKILALLALAPLLSAAIDGVVVNQTSGKPQAGVIVSLVQPGQNGMQSLASARSGADGAFKLDRDVPPPPALLQAIYQGVTYTTILAPGAPASGVRVMVSDTTTNPAAAKLTQHILLLQPGANSIQVNENFAVENDTNQTFQDSKNGSVQFYLPDGVEAPELSVSGTAGMAIRRKAVKTDKPNIYKFDYAIKPGRTTFEAMYMVDGADKFKGRVVGDTPLRLATPPSVTLSGDSLKDLGQEPQSRAHVYEVTAKDYEVTVEGTGTLGGGGGEDNGEPAMHQENARLYTRLPLVLSFSFAILLLGGVLIFRRGAA